MKEDIRHDPLSLGLLLALTGGFLDAYTYLLKGHVFANAQTGNMVLLSLYAFSGQLAKALNYLWPILAFVAGVFIVEFGRRVLISTLNWRRFILLTEALLLFAVALLKTRLPDQLANITISFICSMQVSAFRYLGDLPYATTMCTGNLRSFSVHLYAFISTRERTAVISALQYFAVISAFILGAAVCVLLVPYFSESALLFSIGLIGLATWLC